MLSFRARAIHLTSRHATQACSHLCAAPSHRYLPSVTHAARVFPRSIQTKSSSSTATTFKAIASQSNGLQHGSTVYGVTPSDKNDDATRFQIQKTHEHVLTIWNKQRRDGEPTTMTPAMLFQGTTERAIDFLSDLFLPRDFQKSVTPDYFPYAKWYFVGTIASAASGVLSMQSLLYAIGLGAGSIPTAAAVNWVLKDGLGQFGGVMFASLVNNRYDADPKRWRVVSAVSLDAAVLLEIFTPLMPAYFLPMASIANVAKNISWLSASATRAGFHNSFALRENLADITAKAGSQSIASSIIGTGLGIAISQITGASTLHVLSAFAVLSSIHLFSVHRALTSVGLRTLNSQRLHLVLDHFLTSEGTSLPTQDAVGARESILPTMLTGYQSLYAKSIVNGEATLHELSKGSPTELHRLREFFKMEQYLLNVSLTGETYRIDVALHETATSTDTLYAHLHAMLIQRRVEKTATLNQADFAAVCRDCYTESKSLGIQLIKLLEHSQWHTENLLVEEKGMRYKWID